MARKIRKFEAEIAQVHAESARLQESLLKAIDKDTEAFNLVSASLICLRRQRKTKLPVGKRCSKPSKEATKSPYGMMEDAHKQLKKAVGKSNTNARQGRSSQS